MGDTTMNGLLLVLGFAFAGSLLYAWAVQLHTDTLIMGLAIMTGISLTVLYALGAGYITLVINPDLGLLGSETGHVAVRAFLLLINTASVALLAVVAISRSEFDRTKPALLEKSVGRLIGRTATA